MFIGLFSLVNSSIWCADFFRIVCWLVDGVWFVVPVLSLNRLTATSHNYLRLIIRLTTHPFARLGAVLHVGRVRPYVSVPNLSRKCVRNHVIS
jgi:hypothetical protein